MPTSRQVHVDAMLTNISVAYIQEPNAFVADKIFPVVPVEKKSDRYYQYDRGDLWRDEAKLRAPGTESAGGDYNIDNTPTYYCDVYAFHKDLTDEEKANSDSVLNPERDATVYVTNKLLIRRENIWANKYFVSDVWASEKAGVTTTPTTGQFLRWDKEAATPINDLSVAKLAVLAKTGYKPNVMVLGVQVYESLCNHPMVLDRIKYTQKGIVTKELLAALFDVERVEIAYAVQNTAPKGKSDQYNFILGKSALLAYAAPAPGLQTPSAGYTFAWKGLLGAGAFGNRIQRIDVPLLHAERIEGEMAFDCKLVATDLGYFFKDAVS